MFYMKHFNLLFRVITFGFSQTKGKRMDGQVDILLNLLVWMQEAGWCSALLFLTSCPGQSDNLWVLVARLAHEPVSAWTCRAKRAVHRRHLPRKSPARTAGALWLSLAWVEGDDWGGSTWKGLSFCPFLESNWGAILVHFTISVLSPVSSHSRQRWSRAIHSQAHLRESSMLGAVKVHQWASLRTNIPEGRECNPLAMTDLIKRMWLKTNITRE